jgi:hypothetical protein
MHSKNKPRMTSAEREHVGLVKSVPCVVCDAEAPSVAHEPVQGAWFLSIALCEACHVGKGGIHGDQSMWRLRFRTGGTAAELLAINETLKRVYG